jgi:enoyl-CoA hydratase
MGMPKYKWLKSETCIEFSVKHRVARIALNRPHKRNAMTDAMRIEIHDALLEADDRTDVSVIVIEGRGQDFCAGGDLTASYDSSGAEPVLDANGQAVEYRGRVDTVDNDAWHCTTMTERSSVPLFRVHKPVIAKVQGHCLAEGTDIALGCDIVIAAEDARIGHPGARANGTPPFNFWLYHCGPQWAKRMLFTGDLLSGKDAARVGLVLDAVPTDRLDTEVDELARRISLVDVEVLATHKRAINMGLELAGARTLQRITAELDARAHATNGPRRQSFRADMKAHGLKQALKNRNDAFGNSIIKLFSK